MLDQITPVLITFNEALNIGRTLKKLTWAREIVVVDSGSTDETLSIIAGFANVRVVSRPIKSLADQWNFAIHETGIEADWILRLDADYVLTDELVAEISRQTPPADVAGYRVNFIFCVFGTPLRASLYPPDVRLFRRKGLEVYQDGHTERYRFSGAQAVLKNAICHDDRKTISRYLWSQDRYQVAEAVKLAATPSSQLDWTDRLRKRGIFAPIVVLLYCLFWKGLVLDGRPGIFYCFQRMLAETILALNLLDARLRSSLEESGNRSEQAGLPRT